MRGLFIIKIRSIRVNHSNERPAVSEFGERAARIERLLMQLRGLFRICFYREGIFFGDFEI